MASGPITSWQINGETMETVTDYSLGLQTPADGDCRDEIKRLLLLGIKTMTKALTVWITRNCGKFFERWEYQTT